MEGPLMRASHVQANLQALARFGDRERAVRRELPPDVIDTIEEASRIGWLPLSLDAQLTEAVDRVVGREALCEWARASMKRSFQGPLLRPLFDAAVRVFGLTPSGLFRRAPAAWSLIYRNAGELRVDERGPNTCALIYEDGASALVDSDACAASIAASFEAIFDACHTSGEVTYARSGDRLVFTARWT